MFSDKRIGRLKEKGNAQVDTINCGMQADKLTLNYFKTDHMQIHEIYGSHLKLYVDTNFISRSCSVNYLSVYRDDCLSWSNHIDKVALNLSKCNEICNINYVITLPANAADAIFQIWLLLHPICYHGSGYSSNIALILMFIGNTIITICWK